jgi:hypothetical protein
MTATHAPALLTATRYEVRWTTHAGAPGVTYCATPEAADKWADTIRLNGRSSAVEVVTVEVSVAVGDYVTVRAYGREREGRVVELNRSRAVVEFVRNASGEKATRAFSVATEVQLVAKGDGRLAAEQAVAEVVEEPAAEVAPTAPVGEPVTVTLRPVGRDLHEVVRNGQAVGRVSYSAAYWWGYTTTGERVTAGMATADDAVAALLLILDRAAALDALPTDDEPLHNEGDPIEDATGEEPGAGSAVWTPADDARARELALDDEEPADGAAPGQDAAGVSDPHVPAQTAHLMGDDLLAACGSTGDRLGLYVIPSSTPERITCRRCLLLAVEVEVRRLGYASAAAYLQASGREDVRARVEVAAENPAGAPLVRVEDENACDRCRARYGSNLVGARWLCSPCDSIEGVERARRAAGCDCDAVAGPHAVHCEECSAPVDRCVCDPVLADLHPAERARVERLAARYGVAPAEVVRTARVVVADEPGPEVDDPREEPRPLEWSEVAAPRPAHVPASVPDAEVGQYLDAYPYPGA